MTIPAGSERCAVGLALLHDMLAVAEQLATRHGARLLQPDGAKLMVGGASFSLSSGASFSLAHFKHSTADFVLMLSA